MLSYLVSDLVSYFAFKMLRQKNISGRSKNAGLSTETAIRTRNSSDMVNYGTKHLTSRSSYEDENMTTESELNTKEFVK